MKLRLAMAEGFPGDYYPFGVVMVVLVKQFSIVQFLGRSRMTNSHACYTSLTLVHFWGPNHRSCKVNSEPGDGNWDSASSTSHTFRRISLAHEEGTPFE